MAFKKGQSGNPGGRSRERLMADALRAAVNAEDPKTRRRKLQLIAEGVADAAVAMEPWAVAMVFDRLDGKPAQESTVTIDDKRDAADWTRAELVRLLNNAANGSGGTPEEDGRSEQSDSVH